MFVAQSVLIVIMNQVCQAAHAHVLPGVGSKKPSPGAST